MRKTALAAALACATLAAPALADSFASATFSNFRISLFDLDPTDSFAPSIYWDDAPGYSSLVSGMVSASGPSTPPVSDSYIQFGAGQFGALQATVTTPYSQASSRVTSGVPQFDGGAIEVSGQARQAPGAGSEFRAEAQAVGWGVGSPFALSPKTAVVFSGLGSVRAAVEGKAGGGGEAQAGINMTVTGNGPGGPGGTQSSFDSLRAFTKAASGSTDTFAEERMMVGSFLNNSLSEIWGELRLVATADGLATAGPVPEPGSYAMLLAGLGLMAGVARRRRFPGR